MRQTIMAELATIRIGLYKRQCKHWALQIIVVLAFFVLAKMSCGRTLAQIDEVEIEYAADYFQYSPPDYDHSIYVDLIEQHPGAHKFICGDVVRMVSNPEQIAIVFDYHKNEQGKWVYALLPAHYQEDK